MIDAESKTMLADVVQASDELRMFARSSRRPIPPEWLVSPELPLHNLNDLLLVLLVVPPAFHGVVGIEADHQFVKVEREGYSCPHHPSTLVQQIVQDFFGASEPRTGRRRRARDEAVVNSKVDELGVCYFETEEKRRRVWVFLYVIGRRKVVERDLVCIALLAVLQTGTFASVGGMRSWQLTSRRAAFARSVKSPSGPSSNMPGGSRGVKMLDVELER
ncbi:hypothetical protein FA95DRAFT_1047572 [Auriscalpium vulgare]|uniref:Uncharacterized protein n=1 Tax=Auriscalpium vulgare TaxID=40419 RepID=A0ACB8S8Z6_9AGAM|nr:hypothetical protein FA95DRAFT_1047572 [Auriscalpium vulgare]